MATEDITAFKHVTILPNYAGGFSFSWILSQSFAEPLPWTFVVEQAPAPDGPWMPISTALVNTYVFDDMERRVVSKDPVLWFRIVLTDGNDVTYTSAVMDPYGKLNRREWLIVRDIMRREILQASKMSGVPGRIWMDSRGAATKCPECLDPITGEVIDSNCGVCLGTGSIPPYFGPFPVWLTFSPVRRKLDPSSDGTGTRDPRVFTIRMIGAPPVRPHDIAIDTIEDRRYHVDEVKVDIEIRRVPVIQTLIGTELPKSDPAYQLGDEEGDIIPAPKCDDDVE